MVTIEEYLKEPLENAETLIRQNKGVLTDEIEQSINELRSDVLAHYEKNHFIPDMSSAKNISEKFAITTKKGEIVADIEMRFDTIIDFYRPLTIID